MDDDRKRAVLNKVITVCAWFVSSFTLLYNHLQLLFLGHTFFFLVFPLMYVLLKFGMSDCVNKGNILEKGLDDDTTMVFKDERRNIKTWKFVKEEMLNANFWIVVESTIFVYIALGWK